MLNRLFTLMVVIAALTLLTGCGGGKGRKRTKAPEPPATVVDPIPTPGDEDDGGSDEGTTPDGGALPPDDGTPDVVIPDDGTPDGGTPGDGAPDGGTPGDGTPGDGTPGDTDPFELPSGELDPLGPLFPVNENPGDNGNGDQINLVLEDEPVATPEPATLLTSILGASLLGIRRNRRQSH